MDFRDFDCFDRMLFDSDGIGEGNITDASKNKNPSFSSERAKIAVSSRASNFSTTLSILSHGLNIKNRFK